MVPGPTPRGMILLALAVICLANFFNYLDRIICSAVLPRIEFAAKEASPEAQHEKIGLSEPRKGGLWTAFTLGYMLASPFVGYFADRTRRTVLFSVCIFIWSLATFGSGLAKSYAPLFAMRLLTGVGEAGCLIVGPSLLSDYFRRENRGKMLSLFFLGMPLGSVAGFAVGTPIADEYSWRAAFFLAGTPGLVLATLMLLLPEPPRGATEETADLSRSATRLLGPRDYRELLMNGALAFIILGQAAATFAFSPMVHFGIDFLDTAKGMSFRTAGPIMGVLILASGLIGNFLAGWLGDRASRRDPGAYALLASIGYALGCVFVGIGVVAGPRWLFLPALAVGMAAFFACMPVVNTHVANVVSPRKRAMAFAGTVFLVHLLGDTGSPILFGQLKARLEPVHAYLWFLIPTLLLASAACYIACLKARARSAAA